jgi:uncharacterized protein YidB (DUF937 family)
MDHGNAAGGLASALPEIVDKLTPNGRIENDAMAQGLDLLKGVRID